MKMRISNQIFALSLTCMTVSGCSENSSTNEPTEDWGSSAQVDASDADQKVSAAPNDTSKDTASPAQVGQNDAVKKLPSAPDDAPPNSNILAGNQPVYFYCDPKPEGRSYFYVDPNNLDRGVAGFEFSEAYAANNPDETPPVTELTVAQSGSGMRFVNERMEFHGKSNFGILTLSDGTTVNCNTNENP